LQLKEVAGVGGPKMEGGGRMEETGRGGSPEVERRGRPEEGKGRQGCP